MSKRRNTGKRVRAAAADFTDSARERAEEAVTAAEDALEAAYDAAEDGIDEARDYVKRQWRDRPLAVAGVTLGAGILIGVLLGSRR